MLGGAHVTGAGGGSNVPDCADARGRDRDYDRARGVARGVARSEPLGN